MFGKPRIPWKIEEYLGETSESDGYTTDWSYPEENSTAFSYFVEQFAKVIETDFNFLILIPELINLQEKRIQDEEQDQKQSQLEDRSLGKIDVPLSLKRIKQQVSEGGLPPVGLTTKQLHLQLNAIWAQAKEQKPDQIKNIVNTSDYERVEVEPERAFYLKKTMSRKEKEGYMKLLKYSNIFAWTPSDL